MPSAHALDLRGGLSDAAIPRYGGALRPSVARARRSAWQFAERASSHAPAWMTGQRAGAVD